MDGEVADEDDALTLAQAAAVLGLSTTQRISQMLRDGSLSGPTYEGHRAPQNAGRVWRSSLDAEMARRKSEEARRKTGRGRSKKGSPAGGGLLHRETAQKLKVAADVAAEDLRAERQRRRYLASQLTRLTAELYRITGLFEAELDVHDKQDRIISQYSDALTLLLGEDWPPE